MRDPRLLGMAVAVLLSFVGVSCGEPEAAPAGNAADASPSVTATFEPSPTIAVEPAATDEAFPDGLVLTMSVSYDPTFRPEEFVRSGDLLVIGQVVEELPARWTTPDGRRPPDLLADVPHPYIIVTPYVLELEVPDDLSTLTSPVIPLNDRGAAAFPSDAKRIVAVVIGGVVEKDSVVNGSPWRLLSVGE